MKATFLLLTLFCTTASYSSSFDLPKSKQVRQWVLESISEMPSAGGYELSALPVKKMRDAFTWQSSTELTVDPFLAIPSYCTTATYMVFYKTLEKYWAWSRTTPGKTTLEKLKPAMDDDGMRIWGRWNSNGPATAKFFNDAKLGKNFDDIKLALAGDFLKIYWNDQVGKFEKGHSVIYLGQETIGGVPMIRFWGSSKSTSGFSEKLIPKSDAIRMIFSRLEMPQNFSNIETLSERDAFLASMLTKVSNWTEVRKVSGMTNKFTSQK